MLRKEAFDMNREFYLFLSGILLLFLPGSWIDDPLDVIVQIIHLVGFTLAVVFGFHYIYGRLRLMSKSVLLQLLIVFCVLFVLWIVQ